MPNDIQKRIIFLRKQANKSQQKMADALNMKRTTYDYNETKAKRLPEEFIEKVAVELKVSVNYLRNGQEEKPPKVEEPKGPDDYVPVLTNADIKILDILKSLPPKIRAKHRAAIEADFKIYNKKDTE